MDGFYQKWTFLFYQAKCHSVPIKSISSYSRIYINEEHEALVAKRVEAHNKLKQYVDLCSGGRGLLSGINLESDPIWRELWNMYAQLRNEVASLAASLKTERWLKFLEKIDNDAEADHRHFYSSIAKVKGTKVDSFLRTLYTSPPSKTNPTPATTSNPEKIKDILRNFFEKQAESYTSTDPRFDQNFFATVYQEVTAVCSNAVGPEELEKPLTLDEVTEAIGQAQNNKAPGQDSVFNESMNYGGEAAVHSCFFLFTHLFENGICPRAWSKALVHLIFKGGDKDPLSCSSYRPISLISIVSKIYEWIFLNRAGGTYAEDEELLPDEQAGFRKGRSLMEQTYILRKLLDERKRRTKPTYIYFVDLKSAFPSTWRDAIWWRMQEAGITGKLYRAVKSLYENCIFAVLTSFGPTEWFRKNSGTRQGAILSPFLFSFVMISPLVRELTEQGLGIDMAGKLTACLLFADDIALIASSESELRKMMAIATSFFHKWRFTVSASKTRVVAFGAGETRGPLKDRPWSIDGRSVDEAVMYTYLGINLEKQGWASIFKTNCTGARISENRLASVTRYPRWASRLVILLGSMIPTPALDSCMEPKFGPLPRSPG
jgi:hypothetical protein